MHAGIPAGRQRRPRRALPLPRALAVGCAAAALTWGSPQASADTGATVAATVQVRKFEIDGATAVPASELQAALAPWVGRPLTREDLTQAARAVEKLYRSHRRVARVSLPPQDVSDGSVRLQVTEARAGKVRITGTPTLAIDAGRAAAIVAGIQTPRTPLQLDAVEHATALLNAWPGLTASASLVPGDEAGETDIALTLADRRPWDLTLRVDNEGPRATGRPQFIADSSLVLPGGGGHALGVTTVVSEGIRDLRLSASTPIGGKGLRALLYGGAMRYRLVAPAFNALDIKGPAATLGVGLEWAVHRSSGAAHDVGAQLEHRRFRNEALGTLLADYSIDALSARYTLQTALPLQGSWASLRLSGTLGSVDLDGSPNQLADALTARVAGRYALLRANAQVSLQVAPRSLWVTRMGTQVANKNLDVAERFAIGGSSAVRAYPAGEAYGSYGALVNTELQTGLAPWLPGLSAAVFVDAGSVYQLKDAAFSGAPARNRVTLAGAGLWAEWRPQAVPLVARLTVAQPLGRHHPINAGTQLNQDGSRYGTQWWLSAQWTL